MIESDKVRKHFKHLAEAQVKAHVRRSKTGKAYNVGSYDREVKKLIGKRMSFKNTIASGDTDAYGSNMSGIFMGLDPQTGHGIFKQKNRRVLMPRIDVPALRSHLKKFVKAKQKGRMDLDTLYSRAMDGGPSQQAVARRELKKRGRKYPV